MKNIYGLFILFLVSSVLLIGCVPDSNNNHNDGYITEDGEIVGVDNGNDYITEDGSTTDGEENSDVKPEVDSEANEDVTPGEENGTGNTPDDNINVGTGENNENTQDDNTQNNSGDNSEGNPDGDNTTEQPEPPKVGTEVGDLMASVTLETINGSIISTDDLRGKIVILNIWATWCPPCKAELPDFNRIATEYKDQVVIIAAHTVNGNVNAESYVEENFPETDIIFAYDTPYSEAYVAAGGVGYVPHTAITDENGVIVYSDYGILSYNQLVYIIESQLNN